MFLYNNDDFFFLDYVYKKDLFENTVLNHKNKTTHIKFNVINDFDINTFIHGNNEYCQRIVKTNEILKTITNKKLINNHYTKILRKSTLKMIEINYAGLLEELTLIASDIFLVFCIKIKCFLILQAINKKISVKCVILRNHRTPPGGVKTL